MNKCPICGKKFVKDESDFYFCPECQTKYHKSCFERFGCTNSECSYFKGCAPYEEAITPITDTEISEITSDTNKGFIKKLSDYHEAEITCPDCGRKVSVFMWNYRLGCPTKYCLEYKEHIYWRAGAISIAAALLFLFIELRSKLFLNHFIWFTIIFALLYVILIHLGMYFKIKAINQSQVKRFFVGLAQGAVITALLAGFAIAYPNIILSGEYAKGKALMESGEYIAAEKQFKSIKNYRDSELMMEKAAIKQKQVIYKKAEEAFNMGNYQEAISLYSSIPDYMDSKKKIKDAKYAIAKEAISSGDIKTAISIFTDLGSYRDSADILKSLTKKALPSIGGGVLGLFKHDDDESLLDKGADFLGGLIH